jgi:hypothetical protein
MRTMDRILCFASLLLLSCASTQSPPRDRQPTNSPSTIASLRSAAKKADLTLNFSELLVPGSQPPQLSPTLLSATGKRVRMVGFMAHLEQAPRDAFYLTKRPVSCDEMGAGTGDLPIDSVRVNIVPAPKEVAFVPGPIEVTGVLEVGRREETDGAVSHIRLVLALPSTQSLPKNHEHN